MSADQARERSGDVEELVAFIRDHRGFDFTGYKRPSLTRRITKRMEEAGFRDYDEYRRYLAGHPEEFVPLFNTILINVTSFFRDDIAWSFLREEVIPRIVDARIGDGIRIWSTGCATGEEAYTLAMVFAEALGEDEFKARVKIYATDVDDDALNQGRQGSYSATQVDPVPPELREQYFEQTNHSFVFRKDLRRLVIFGRHDLVQDPPISKIDLLVCRNTLMYFDSPTQHSILTNFHFALRDEGFLFLGKSEALAARTNLFAAIDLKRRVFVKVPRAARRAPRAAPRDRRRRLSAAERPGDPQLGHSGRRIRVGPGRTRRHRSRRAARARELAGAQLLRPRPERHRKGVQGPRVLLPPDRAQVTRAAGA